VLVQRLQPQKRFRTSLALAEAGRVVSTAGVQRKVASLFVAEDRDSRELQGLPEPVTLYGLSSTIEVQCSPFTECGILIRTSAVLGLHPENTDGPL
jgi:hypothetical protein